jgi:uncharacterized protein YraI
MAEAIRWLGGERSVNAMRAHILRILIALVLSLGVIAPQLTSAQDSGSIAVGDTVMVGDDGVNFRDSAGTDGELITTLDTGILLEIIDGPESADGYTWWMGVVLNEDSVDQGISGWIVEEFLTVDDGELPPDDGDGDTDTPTPTPTATSTATPDVDDGGDEELTFDNAGWVVVVDGPLNLRKNPGLEGDVVRTLGTDETATVVNPSVLTERDDYTWINVTTEDGETGWVATDFLDPLADDPCPDESCAPSEHQDLLDANAVGVIDGPLNIRSDASLDGTVLDTVATGAVINTASDGEVQSADDFDWLKVDYQGDDAWVAVDFIAVSDETCEVSPCLPDDSSSDDPFADALGVRVFDGPLNVRDVAGLGGSILTVLETGAEIPVDSRAVLTDADGYTWIRIATSTLNGWVATDFVEPMDTVPCVDGACYPAELNSFFGATGAFVIDGPLNLRADVGTDSAILMTLDDGDYMWIESVIGSDPYEADGYLWVEVSVAGETGFVAIDFVEPSA